MGLLDMFGTSLDDPRTMAVMQGIQGLLSTNRPLQGISAGLLGYGGAMAQAKQAAMLDELRKLQTQQHQMQLRQAQRQEAQQKAQDDFRQSIPSPQMAGIQGAMAANGGPTNAAAAAIPQADPNAQFLHGAMQAGLVDPVQYIQAQRKDTAPLISKPGDVARDPRTGKVLWQNEDKQNTPADYQLYQLSGAQGRGMSFDEWDLARRRAGASNTTVSLGSPVPVTLPDGSTALVQPSNRPGAPPQIMSIPGTNQPLRPQASEKTREALRDNSTAMNKINRALAAIEDRPNSLGLKNYLDIDGAVMQRVDPEGIEVRALLADIGSQKIHDRSGAAVSAAEFPRLRPFVPQATDSTEAARKKLVQFRTELQFIQQELNSGATLQEVSAPRQAFTMPSADAIAAELARRQKGGR